MAKNKGTFSSKLVTPILLLPEKNKLFGSVELAMALAKLDRSNVCSGYLAGLSDERKPASINNILDILVEDKMMCRDIKNRGVSRRHEIEISPKKIQEAKEASRLFSNNEAVVDVLVSFLQREDVRITDVIKTHTSSTSVKKMVDNLQHEEPFTYDLLSSVFLYADNIDSTDFLGQYLLAFSEDKLKDSLGRSQYMPFDSQWALFVDNLHENSLINGYEITLGKYECPEYIPQDKMNWFELLMVLKQRGVVNRIYGGFYARVRGIKIIKEELLKQYNEIKEHAGLVRSKLEKSTNISPVSKSEITHKAKSKTQTLNKEKVLIEMASTNLPHVYFISINKHPAFQVKQRSNGKLWSMLFSLAENQKVYPSNYPKFATNLCHTENKLRTELRSLGITSNPVSELDKDVVVSEEFKIVAVNEKKLARYNT